MTPEFGERITMDYKVMKDFEKGLHDEACIFTIKDIATGMWASHPLVKKDAADAYRSLQNFPGVIKPENLYHSAHSDKDKSIVKALEMYGSGVNIDQPHRFETNIIIGRQNRKSSEDASCRLPQSGNDDGCWLEAVDIYSVLSTNTENGSKGQQRSPLQRARNSFGCVRQIS